MPDFIVISAARYCLQGPDCYCFQFIDWLQDNWGTLTENTQSVILRDIIETLCQDESKKQWSTFAIWAFDHVTENQVAWVKFATKHKPESFKLFTRFITN